MPSFRQRSTLPELMDDPAVPAPQVQQALREIQTINRLLGGYDVVLTALQQLAPRFPTDRPLRILDVASGGGDTLREIADWARRKGIPVELIGVDINPVMTAFAASRSAAYPEIRFVTADAWSEEVRQLRPDIVTNCLFAHHIDDPQLGPLMRQLYDTATIALIINDLHRHWFAYYSIAALTWLFSRSHLVRYDARLSVARSLRRAEWQRTLEAVGIERYSLRWRWAFRWQIILTHAPTLPATTSPL